MNSSFEEEAHYLSAPEVKHAGSVIVGRVRYDPALILFLYLLSNKRHSVAELQNDA